MRWYLLFLLFWVPLVWADEAGQGGKKFLLRLGFKKGERLFYRSENRHAQKAYIMDEKKVEETSLIEFFVEDVAEDGVASIVRKELKILYSSPEGEFSSEGKVGHPLGEKKRKVFEARLKNSLRGRVTPEGEVKEVEGVEKMLADMKEYIDEMVEYLMESNPSLMEKAKKNPRLKEEMRRLVVAPIEAGIKYSFGFFDFLPEEKVSVGDEWKVVQDKKIVKLKWKAKLQEVKKVEGRSVACIVLELEGMERNEEEYPLAKRSALENAKGEGRVEFDIEAGKVKLLEAKVSYDLKDRLSGSVVASHRKEVRIEMLKEPPKRLKKPSEESKREGEDKKGD